MTNIDCHLIAEHNILYIHDIEYGSKAELIDLLEKNKIKYSNHSICYP